MGEESLNPLLVDTVLVLHLKPDFLLLVVWRHVVLVVVNRIQVPVQADDAAVFKFEELALHSNVFVRLVVDVELLQQVLK